jgi:SAM-dependent methyltransferase
VRLRRRRPPDKLSAELAFWEQRRASGGELEAGVPFYRWAYTEHFGLAPGFYAGKRILDVGCGPRGSLEWADMAAERVGLDPLADRYAALRSRDHAMAYVAAPAERIPFADGHFDVVSTINSLDHVDDVEAALREIARVSSPTATLLVVVDIEHAPTETEPQRLGWDLVERLERDWRVVERRDYERPSDNLYDNLRAGRTYDRRDTRPRAAVLSARLERG